MGTLSVLSERRYGVVEPLTVKRLLMLEHPRDGAKMLPRHAQRGDGLLPSDFKLVGDGA
jgi:hypothetical protein